VYFYALLNFFIKSDVGCFVGGWFVGASAYDDDDLALLAPSAAATRRSLHICEDNGANYNVILTPRKRSA
jgi:hypothetical protein